MKNKSYWIASAIFAFVLLIVACNSDDSLMDPPTSFDNIIDLKLNQLELNRSDFAMPEWDMFGNYLAELEAQGLVHPDNPLTPAKVALGQNIFWDPVFSQNTLNPANMRTMSCGTCHISEGHSGLFQGLGEGGQGTGDGGRSRDQDGDFVSDPSYGRESIDAQPVRVPTQVNATYKPNVLWNGMFGGRDDNIINGQVLPALPDEFPHDLSKEFQFDGPEIQAMAGLSVHRMLFDENIITEANYKNAFDEVFNNTAFINQFEGTKFVDNGFFLDRNVHDLGDNPSQQPNDTGVKRVPVQYSRLAAALAVSAYVRAFISNEAPFQDYARGDNSAMTELQKQGFIVFLDKGCVNCHNGPALTDGDFHALGTADLLENHGESFMDRIGNPLGGPAAAFQPEDVEIGRAFVTQNDSDVGAFLTPTLYNVGEFFFHGSFEGSLEEVIDYKINGVPETDNPEILDAIEEEGLFRPIEIDDDERIALIEFVKTALKDQTLDDRYRPTEVLSGLCSPNNDFQSVAIGAGLEGEGCN